MLRKRLKLVLIAMGALAIALGGVVAFAGATSALPTTGDGIVPTFVAGNSVYADCVSAPTGQDHIFGLKVENGTVTSYNGTWDKTNTSHTHGNDNPLQVTISNSKVSGGVSSFDWSANMPVDYVFVKGGNFGSGEGAVKYDYSGYGWGGHPATGPWGDTGLVYPKDSISHVLFCTVKKLRVEKTAVASFTREYSWSITKKVKTTDGDYASSGSLSLLNGSSGLAHWQIVADQTGSTEKDFSVQGTITVLDSSPFDVTGVVDESLSNVTFGGACTAKSGTNDKANLSVAKGATVTCSYSAPLASKTDGTNTVDVDPVTPDWMTSTSASKAYAFGNPTSEKNKTVRWADSNGQSKTGITADDTTTYDTSPACPESRTLTNTATLYGDANANLGSSVATVTITCAAPQKLTISKTAAGTFDRTWSWTIDKKVKTGEGAYGDSASLNLESGGSGTANYKVTVGGTSVDGPYTVSGTITVGNPNAKPVTGVSVTDAIAGATIDCLPADGNQSTGLEIAAGGTLTCSYTVTTSDKRTTNSASVTAGNSAYNNTSASVPVTYASTPANENGASVDVSDSFDDGAPSSLGTVTPADLTAGVKQFTYDHVLRCGDSHTYPNTASIYWSAKDEKPIASDSTQVDVTCALPQALEVTKTAAASFTRTWAWHVRKSADQTSFALKDGGTASTSWNVSLVKDEPVDSAWSLSGSITVHNPNGFPVNGVSVTDSLGGTVSCPSTTIAAQGTLVCTYVVSLEGGIAGKNTATASTETKGVAGGSGSADYAFTGPTTKVNENVDVVDTNGKTWNDQTSGFSTSYASGTLPCANATYTNTVRVIGDQGKILDTSAATVATTCSTTPPVNPPVNPPVTPPAPKIDIGVTKSATNPTTSGKTVTYTIVVSNVAQVAANGVDVSDPAPTGISYQSATSSDPTVTCNVSAAVVTCNRPGAFAVGASFVVTIKATATGAAGSTITNEVLVNTTGDINPANNRAQASTRLLAPFKPPVSKPVVKPAVCSMLVVTPKTINVGRKSTISFLVTAGGTPVKGVAVKIVGPGILRTATSGNGKTAVIVNSSKSGIVTVSIAGKKGCNTARVGVVGTFEPPVTG